MPEVDSRNRAMKRRNQQQAFQASTADPDLLLVTGPLTLVRAGFEQMELLLDVDDLRRYDSSFQGGFEQEKDTTGSMSGSGRRHNPRADIAPLIFFFGGSCRGFDLLFDLEKEFGGRESSRMSN